MGLVTRAPSGAPWRTPPPRCPTPPQSSAASPGPGPRPSPSTSPPTRPAPSRPQRARRTGTPAPCGTPLHRTGRHSHAVRHSARRHSARRHRARHAVYYSPAPRQARASYSHASSHVCRVQILPPPWCKYIAAVTVPLPCGTRLSRTPGTPPSPRPDGSESESSAGAKTVLGASSLCSARSLRLPELKVLVCPVQYPKHVAKLLPTMLVRHRGWAESAP
jgi:hypothetical protein